MEIFTISLDHVRFYARIGVDPQERKVGNEFEVSASIEFEASGFQDETLDTSLSYADIYDIVRVEMEKEWQLLESVARSIGMKIKNLRVLDFIRIEVEITKIAPPLSGFAGSATVKWRCDG